MTIPVAIDTDPGVDDAVALMLAMRSPEIRVESITRVAVKVRVGVWFRNAKRLVALVNPSVWPAVAAGCAKPLNTRLTTATHVHGDDGLGGNADKFPVPSRLRTNANGVEQLIEFTRRNGAQGIIIAIGPLTNIARAIQRAPKVMKTLGRLVIMGGAVRAPGNMSPVAEFNIFVDPEAADVVFGFALDTLLIPLDVTRQVILSESKIRSLGRGPLANAVKLITLAAAKKFNGMPMHDALAVAAVIEPSLVGTEDLHVRVETEGKRTRGMTVADFRPSMRGKGSTIAVATTVNANAMLSMLDNRVLSADSNARQGGKGRVAVVGSANVDLSIVVDALPGAGETVLGDPVVQAFGGKGANQAVAAHRAGADVTLVARLGADGFGDEYLAFLNAEGIDASTCSRDKSAPTGVATITISNSGENQIAVASGANMSLTPHVLSPAISTRIAEADVLVTQLEIPIATVKKALRAARASGVTTVHNPAPAQPLDEQFLSLIDVLVCNEVEAQMLTGSGVKTLADARRSAKALRARGIANVVITLGAKGLVYLEEGTKQPVHIAAKRVKAVDTTGAGDTFVGYLAGALAQKSTLRPALELANRAAARSVTKRGAIPSIPKRRSL
jgi:ribokinase